MTTREVLALIPARGGSKGIPRKNLLPILGKPLIAYSIEQAIQSAEITRVIVSTDDPEIAEVAAAFGAEVPFRRPLGFADDLSPDIDVFRHALEWLRENDGYEPEMLVHLRPPGPARRVDLIDNAVRTLRAAPHADALRSVSLAMQTPFKMWYIREDHRMEPVLRLPGVVDSQSLPRQQLPQVYWQNGYVDVLRPRAVLEHGSMWGNEVIPYIVNEPNLEIDYPENIPVVEEALLKLRNGLSLGDEVESPRHSV